MRSDKLPSLEADVAKSYRQLVKRYHPDRCTDPSLRAAYERITAEINVRYGARLKRAVSRDAKRHAPAADVRVVGVPATVNDQAYAYYRQGIEIYRRIYPTHLAKVTVADKLFSRAYNNLTAEEILPVVESVLRQFPLAVWCFRRVLTEYPQSPWAADSRDKIGFLKRLHRRYEVIAENLCGERADGVAADRGQ